MPIYEYRCEECGHRFEAWLRSSQSPEPTECPSCNTTVIKRVPSLFGTTRPAGAVGAMTSSTNSAYSSCSSTGGG